MPVGTQTRALIRQHLIDPETCIRCNTCESRCPSQAIRHERNYVVDPAKCNFCMKCVRPCPTGAVDHYFELERPFPVDEQLGWIELPRTLQEASAEPAPGAPGIGRTAGAEDAPSNAGECDIAPASASKPQVNVFTQDKPARGAVSENFRITSDSAENDVHHIIFEFGGVPFPYLEGQSIGIVPPGVDRDGKPHAMRLYSIACARDGEKPNTSTLALAVKRVAERGENSHEIRGVASNWLCDLRPGEAVDFIGPFGSTFLMPNDPEADILMICTGTGVAPFRGFTHRRRRTYPNASGKLVLIFGARAPEELPYYIALQKYVQSELHRELVYSRMLSSEREYVQDRLRQRSREVVWFLRRPKAHIYICGLHGLEEGVDAALAAIAGERAMDWPSIKTQLRNDGRYHVETY